VQKNAGAKKRCVALAFPSSSGAGGKEEEEERRGRWATWMIVA
jgi:hypothetical protein